MTDSVEIALIVAIPPTLTGLAALVTSIMNGINARKAARMAETAVVKAETAAMAASLTHEELSQNTVLTVQTRDAVEQVARQTNGARERQDALIAKALNDIASLGLAVGILQEKLAKAEAEKSRLAKQVEKE